MDLGNYVIENFQKAIDCGYIQAYYQPVIRTISRRLCSFEALARWIDPTHGMIRPDQFIPVLEEHRLIHLLDQCIVRQACARIRKAMDLGEIPVPVSVNLSRLDFVLCDIFEAVNSIVALYQIPHGFIHIEITESVLAEQESVMHEIVDKFHAAGYQIWMDDFGSGYSSLNVLKEFFFDEIKLDMRFLSTFNQRSRYIMTSVVQMAKDLSIHTLCEGVETEEQFNFLLNIGCEKVQGYFFGKPMPYDESLDNVQQKGVLVEIPSERVYYDAIGNINFLSAVPFLTQAERDSITDPRQLNSIPLCMAEANHSDFRILFYNKAFEETVSATGMVSDVFSPENRDKPQPYALLPVKVINLMDSLKTGEMGSMYFISNGEYYEIRAKCIAESNERYNVLLSLQNLSKASRAERTDRLDNGIRQIYTMFERITMYNLKEDSISPLYVATREDLVSGRTGLKALTEEYARNWVFHEDREAYLKFMDSETMNERVSKSMRQHISRYFRIFTRHGQFAWKRFTLLRIAENEFVELIRDAQAEVNAFILHDVDNKEATDQDLTPELLWHNLASSEIIKMFWKNANRRFVGVTKGFLEYYGFDSALQLIGKNDEDLGWHIHADHYMNDELKVIREGEITYNVLGNCIVDGENREILASKMPLYNERGSIVGLLGYFLDRDNLVNPDDIEKGTKKKDLLTGLLNTRGIWEEAHSFQDEYYLRGVDFARFHVCIDDFASFNKDYGFDFGDKTLNRLGISLKEMFGTSSAIGRSSGHKFIILKQVKDQSEASKIRKAIKAIADSTYEIEGVPVTFYLSVGYTLFSECEDLEEQAKKSEVRLLADQSEQSSIESRLSRSAEIFHVYDDLPISYSVVKVVKDDSGHVKDAILFYVNHIYEKKAGLSAAQLLGMRTSQLFPNLEEDWYDKAERAALNGEAIVDYFFFENSSTWYYMTVSQVIHPGYCCFTYQEIDLFDINAKMKKRTLR